MKGWIKIWRKIVSDEIYPQNRAFTDFEAWIDILANVNHETKLVRLSGRKIIVKSGESVRSLDTWKKRWGWKSKMQVKRFLKRLEQQRKVVTVSETVSLRLSVCNWDTYQNERYDSVTVADTKQEVKKKVYSRVANSIKVLNDILGSKFSPKSAATQKHLSARMNEGHTDEDIKLVISHKVNEWKGDPKMDRFLRPQTLFGTNFESYLQEAKRSKENEESNKNNPFSR